MKNNNNIIIGSVVIILLGIGAYFFIKGSSERRAPVDDQGVKVEDKAIVDKEEEAEDKSQTVIGTSVGGREITAYHYGDGDTDLLFVGGIHGGYEWNTVLVAYELMDYLQATPAAIPANVKVTVIPVLNPDGLNKVVGKDGRFSATDVSSSQDTVVAGRFNANNVDLNRNFDCDWQASAKWQSKTVSGGSAAFTEPESQAIKNYVETNKPDAVVVWYSAAGGVFSSSCHDGVLAETNTLTNTFAKASGYKGYEEFNFYEITGDMVNWLAKEEIPAISVLLTNHQDVEWTKNLAGIKAVLNYYAK